MLTFEWVGSDRIITLEGTDLHITLQNYAGGFDGPINITFI